MSVDELKAKLGELLSALASAATRLERLRGVAFYDSAKDLAITSLPQFGEVESAIRDLELVRDRYGVQESRRIVLQLVYGYFARAGVVELMPEVLDALWVDFLAELDAPSWLTRAVTNLRHFRCEDFPVDLGDGLSIQGRSPEELAALGFHTGVWERLVADWSGWGASSFVLVVETAMPKHPDNLIMMDGSGTWLRCARAIGAMRLIAPGDVGMSVTFFQRVARFNVGIGGIHSTGATVDTIGSPYTWSSERRSDYDATYAALAHLETIGYRRAPGNLDLALRAFMSSYDRFPSAADVRLVDAITALEAILGSEAEIAFKLSFRVASLLAATDEQRGALLKAVKGFYDVRSRIVHGGRLGKRQSASLNAIDDLRDMVRRLLRGFVYFAADDKRSVGKSVFAEDLDAALVDGRRREGLRQLLGFAEPANPNMSSRAGDPA